MSNIIPLVPLIIVAATAVLIMLVLSVRRSHRLSFALCLLGIAGAMATLLVAVYSGPQRIGLLLLFDTFSFFYSALVLAAAFGVVVISYDYLAKGQGGAEEYYVLLLVALLGTLTLISSTHFVSFFLGLEVLSISLYTLIAYRRSAPSFTEAGIKYVILSGASSSFLLFGMALIYGLTGTMEFSVMARLLPAVRQDLMVLAAFVLLTVGIGFKLGVVPFHMWTPDVYQGAPAPVAAFIATVSKGSMFALLLRYFTTVNLLDYPPVFLVFGLIAILSMFVGNLLALFEKNIKRLLAFSSIAHFGYLLVAFLSAGPLRITAVTYYLVAYFVTILGAFAVVALLSTGERDADAAEDYEGLFQERPWLAGTFTLMLLSLAGMPVTAGFLAKIYVVAAGVSSVLWLLVICIIISSAIGLFYYLRVIALMYLPARKPGAMASPEAGLKGTLLLVALLVLLIWWGVYPSPLISLIELIKIGR